MTEIVAQVNHETIEPRTSKERTVERVTIKGRDTLELTFYRVGECIDAWEFVEGRAEDECFDNPEILNKIVVQAVLKRTPCVSIRDHRNETIGRISYADAIKSKSSYYNIQGEPEGY